MTVRRNSVRAVAIAALVAAPAPLFAAGFEIPDNGAEIIARGGTAAAFFGNAYGLQFNPAGIAWQEGLDVRVDVRLVNHVSAFTRADTGNQSFSETSNSAGLFPGPFVAVSYRPKDLLDGKFAFGAGFFGPPAVGKYSFADPELLGPSYTDSETGETDYASLNAATGQRYSLIDNSISIVYPSAAVAYRPLENLSFGLTLQAVYTSIALRQTMAASTFFGETYKSDAIVKLAVTDAFSPSFVAGVAWEPMKNLRVGASFRPQVAILASGTIDVVLPEIAKLTSTTVEVNGATLGLNLPPLARLGASYRFGQLTASAEAIYEGWSANRKFVLTPDVTIKTEGQDDKKLDALQVAKDWKDSFGGRLGATYAVLTPAKSDALSLTVSAGGLFETNAIPTTRQAIDYVTGDRLGGGAGVTLGYAGFSLTLSGMAYAPVKFTVTDSLNERASAEPDRPPVIVSNGEYASSVWLAAVGLAYSTPSSAAGPTP